MFTKSINNYKKIQEVYNKIFNFLYNLIYKIVIYFLCFSIPSNI